MFRYAARRFLLLVPTLLAIYTVTFLLVRAVPGSPWNYSGRPLPQEIVERVKEQYHLNDPLPKQYADYLWRALHGDFGPSYRHRDRTVSQVISAGIPISLQLGLAGVLLAVLLGVPLGVLSSLYHNTPVDYSATFIAVVGFATPPYVSAILLILVFSVFLGWFPTSGWGGLFSTRSVLPVIALSIVPTALFARYTRASMLSVLSEDYVRTARAKGLRERDVIARHTLRNALISVTTIGGLLLANAITGSFFVETIFALPGIGYYYVESVLARDYPLVLGSTLVFSVLFALSNLLVDVSYAALDPRIRYE